MTNRRQSTEKRLKGRQHSVFTKCRIEPSGAGSKPDSNGDNGISGFTIYIPYIEESFPEDVKVYTDNRTLDGKLRVFQTHIVVWA